MRPDVLVALMLCAGRVPILECPLMMLCTTPASKQSQYCFYCA